MKLDSLPCEAGEGQGGGVFSTTTEGPCMPGDGKIVKYQDIVELISEDHRTLSSQMQMPAGSWQRFMTSNYRRKK